VRARVRAGRGVPALRLRLRLRKLRRLARVTHTANVAAHAASALSACHRCGGCVVIAVAPVEGEALVERLGRGGALHGRGAPSLVRVHAVDAVEVALPESTIGHLLGHQLPVQSMKFRRLPQQSLDLRRAVEEVEVGRPGGEDVRVRRLRGERLGV